MHLHWCSDRRIIISITITTIVLRVMLFVMVFVHAGFCPNGKVKIRIFVYQVAWVPILLTAIGLHCRPQWPSGLRRGSAARHLLACGFESRLGHGCLSVVCCQAEVSAKGPPLVQRNPTDCDVSLRVWSRNLKNEAALARVGLLRQRKKNDSTDASDEFTVVPVAVPCRPIRMNTVWLLKSVGMARQKPDYEVTIITTTNHHTSYLPQRRKWAQRCRWGMGTERPGSPCWKMTYGVSDPLCLQRVMNTSWLHL